MTEQIKLSDEGFFAVASLIGQLWTLREVRNNPASYIFADVLWHRDMERQMRRNKLARNANRINNALAGRRKG